ncbi:MAG: ATP-binding cassette domain-containing protein [Gammaproteobacteria bacterium]
MTLLSLTNVSLAYGHHPLLAHADFSIEKGERVCLVGRNGAGKSTLMRVVSGVAVPDDGEVWRRDTLRIAHLEQDVPPDSDDTVYEAVAKGLGQLGALLTEYHNAALAAASDAAALARLTAAQARIEAEHGWNLSQKVETVLSRLNLPADKRIKNCSGGIRRQVMLARALVSEPDLLLLDEPTNHLDIAAIQWLEEYLLSYNGALIFITHDRTFLRHLATRIVELDRGRLTSFPGDFDRYLQKKEELLEIEARAAAKFDKKLAEEEAWIRQGVKARRTRNEGRVRALEALRRARAERIDVGGRVSFDVDVGSTSGKLVVDVRNVSFKYGERHIVRDFSTHILRGDRIGIVGPNGSGKSTLLKLILGELAPTSGQVVVGTRLSIGYFDQHRRTLDPEKTVRENLSEGRDYIDVRGRSRHVIGYLKDFLFPPARIDSPVKSLSGGERNRLLLAKLFTLPANMLVLDEPTNDLDVDTLELLEELLSEYEGTLLLVSHDRTFLDNVVTSTLVFEGDGRVAEYVGGYEDWLRQRGAARAARAEVPAEKPGTVRAVPAENPKKKLSYKEQQELNALPGRIETLENEVQALEQQTTGPDFYRQDKASITAAMDRLAQLRADLEQAYARWEQLDTRA